MRWDVAKEVERSRQFGGLSSGGIEGRVRAYVSKGLMV